MVSLFGTGLEYPVRKSLCAVPQFFILEGPDDAAVALGELADDGARESGVAAEHIAHGLGRDHQYLCGRKRACGLQINRIADHRRQNKRGDGADNVDRGLVVVVGAEQFHGALDNDVEKVRQIAFPVQHHVPRKALQERRLCQVVEICLVHDVNKANSDELMRAAFLQRFPQHVMLLREGDLPDFLHIVVEGSVELYGTHDHHETTIDIIRPVTTFILAAVIRDAVYLKSARTLAPAQILMIPAQTVRDVFSRDAAFARAIVGELAERYRSVVRSLKNEKSAQ